MAFKYNIITYGCQSNVSDSERIATVLEKIKYKKSSNKNEADLVVVNMCSVRQSAVDRAFDLSQKLLKLQINNKKLKTILTGCILEKDRMKFGKNFDLILNIRDLPYWQSFIKQKTFSLTPLQQKKLINCGYFEINPKRQEKSKAFIPISNGCNNFCTYCAVPHTRGILFCRDHKKIIKEVRSAINQKANEIWLLGQNVNNYVSPKDNSIKFPELLKKVSDISGDFRIRIMSSHPQNFTDKLINTMAECQKIAKFLHLPVQSGDNKILKRMNRPYTTEQYKKLIEKIRKKIPNINLSTDIIVGFPGETKKQFENTVKLFKDIKFDMAYISKYSPRPHTPASQMKDDVPFAEKKKRKKILDEIVKKKNKKEKVIVVLGPTASGKSSLAVNISLWLETKRIQKKFGLRGSEIISADSRQVYKGMNLGTGKITTKEMMKIPHHCINVASPKRKFSVACFQKISSEEIKKIIKRKKIPIICGGTAFYIKTLINGIEIPNSKPDWSLRKKLEKKKPSELYQMLEKIDPSRAKTIEKNNPRRLIRALEIVLKTKKPVPEIIERQRYSPLFIGIEKENLKKIIEKRLSQRLSQGMVNEVRKLRKSGLSWKRLESFGLEYEWVSKYLEKKCSYQEMKENLLRDIIKFSKKQMSWWKNDKKIHWVKTEKQAQDLIKNFL